MKTILHTVDIHATPGAVWRALTREDGLAGWWSTRVKAEPHVGGIVRFTFIQEFNPEMKITALEEPRLVGWECVGGHDPWRQNTFQFRIEARGEGAILFFRQEYATALTDEEYGRYNFNWGYYLHSLKQFCESGQGTPNGRETSEEKKAVVERFVDEYKNRHNPDIVDELVSEHCRVHLPLPGLPQGRDGLRVNGQIMCGAFPDVHVTREFFVVEGNIVVERASAKATHNGPLMGLPATGRPVGWTELHAYRVEGGEITEVWSEADFMGVMVQVGAVAPPRA